MLYEEVIKALNRVRVKYVVAGGVACVAYGVVRLTNDLDLMIDFENGNIDKFFKTMGKLGYRPKIPITKDEFKLAKNRKRWKKEKGMLVLSFYHTKDFLKSVDVFTQEPLKFGRVFKNKKNIRIKNLKIPLVSINDLKVLKKKAGRPQDWGDIHALKEIERINRLKNAKKL